MNYEPITICHIASQINIKCVGGRKNDLSALTIRGENTNSLGTLDFLSLDYSSWTNVF